MFLQGLVASGMFFDHHLTPCAPNPPGRVSLQYTSDLSNVVVLFYTLFEFGVIGKIYTKGGCNYFPALSSRGRAQ
jgi:hypothetical protein